MTVQELIDKLSILPNYLPVYALESEDYVRQYWEEVQDVFETEINNDKKRCVKIWAG